MLNKYLSLIIIMSFVSSISFAEKHYSSDIHRTQMDASVKTCPKDLMSIAKEVIQLELAGMRWKKSDPKCFESLKMKYVHAFKVPDAHAQKLIRVKPDSLKILSVKENKSFYSQDITFTVVDDTDKVITTQMSFMTNAGGGDKKPERGCALISSSPEAALVRQDCL